MNRAFSLGLEVGSVNKVANYDALLDGDEDPDSDDGWGYKWDRERTKEKAFKEVYSVEYRMSREVPTKAPLSGWYFPREGEAR